MRFHFKQLDNRGIAHHVLIAVLVIASFASLGAWRVFTANASNSRYAYAINSQTGCELAGRVFQASTDPKECLPQCKVASAQYIPYNSSTQAQAYCMGYVDTEIDETRCINQLHRAFINSLGCARKASPDSSSSRYCPNKLFPKYVVENNVDQCIAGQVINIQQTPTSTEPLETSPLTDEQAGTLGGVQVESSNSDSTAGSAVTANDPSEESPNSFRITVYKDKGFKGISETFTSAQPKLNNNWNDSVSSYKILKGRWQVCVDKDFQKDCHRVWASDPDLTSAGKDNLNNKITSLRPVVTTIFEDASEDIIPACFTATGGTVAANPENTCPQDTVLQCPDNYVLRSGECKEVIVSPSTVVPVDKSFTGRDGQAKCELLGREWIGPADDKTTNGGQYGCSLVSCRLAIDGAARQFEDGAVCISNRYNKPYAQLIDEKQCNNLHRVWIEQVKRCASIPNNKVKDQTVAKANQCTGGYSTYYIYKAGDKQDECFKPSVVQKARVIAKSTGNSLGNVLQFGPKEYCDNFKKNTHHWNGKDCVKDRNQAQVNDTSSAEGTIRVGVVNAASVTTTASQQIGRISKAMSWMRDNNVEIVTVQELSPSQTNWVRSMENWNIYRSDMGGDRGLGIAYRSDKFTVVNTDSVTIPREGANQIEPIITLERKSDKAQITVMSVHLVAMANGKANYDKYQPLQQEVIRNRALSLGGKGHPIVVAGDFNWFFDNRKGWMSPLDGPGVRVMRLMGLPGQEFHNFKIHKDKSISDHHVMSIDVKL